MIETYLITTKKQAKGVYKIMKSQLKLNPFFISIDYVEEP